MFPYRDRDICSLFPPLLLPVSVKDLAPSEYGKSCSPQRILIIDLNTNSVADADHSF